MSQSKPHHLNKRVGALLFLLFCGCLEVMGMGLATGQEMVSRISIELLDLPVHQPFYHLDHYSGHFYGLAGRQMDPNPLPHSFSATLRSYAVQIQCLIRWQRQQYLHLRSLQQVQPGFMDATYRIDPWETIEILI